MMSQRLEEDSDLADVQEALHGTDPKWMTIGIQLKIPPSKLHKIEQQYQNLEDRNRHMQIIWLKSGNATWKDLVAALRKKTVGLHQEADSIEEMHILKAHHHADNGTGEHHTATEPNELEGVTESLSTNERLDEIMEWLLKMGFTVDDISKWVNDKRKLSPITPGDQTATNQSTVPASEDLSFFEKAKVQPQSKKRSNASQTKQPRAKRSRSEGVRTLAVAQNPVHRLSVDSGTMRLKRKKMLENMMKILEELEKIEAADEFIDPVEKERAKDYDDIIKNPMYLTKMKQKVKQGDYDTPEMFYDDFDLIIRNCEEYNGPDSDLMKQANELKVKFNKLCNSTTFPDESDCSTLEKIPSDAESSDESEGSRRDSNLGQEELDQSLSTVCGEEDEEWNPPYDHDDN